MDKSAKTTKYVRALPQATPPPEGARPTASTRELACENHGSPPPHGWGVQGPRQQNLPCGAFDAADHVRAKPSLWRLAREGWAGGLCTTARVSPTPQHVVGPVVAATACG